MQSRYHRPVESAAGICRAGTLTRVHHLRRSLLRSLDPEMSHFLVWPFTDGQRELWRDGDQSDPPGQSGLARVKGAKFRRADKLGGGDMQNVQCAAADSRSVVKGIRFRIHQNTVPQTTSPHQQAGGTIVFHFLPCGLNLRDGEPLLKQGETQCVAQFEAVECGKRQGRRVGLTLRIGPDRIGIGGVKRKQEAGVSVGFHQDSSARAVRTMFGRTLLPKIRRRRAE